MSTPSQPCVNDIQRSLFDDKPIVQVDSTPCGNAIVGYYPAIGASMSSDAIRARAKRDGHAKSTIERTLAKLIHHGTLRVTAGGLELTEIAPPPTGKYSHVGVKRRFGKQTDDEEAEYVREYYSDRLDKLFLTPNCYLMRVIRAVALSGKIAQAMTGGSLNAAKDAVRELGELMQEFEGGLTEMALLDALHFGLFPEDYQDDEEVMGEIQRMRDECHEKRADVIAETIRENETIAAENKERAANRQQLLPMKELPLDLFDGKASDFLSGLVPLGGGERMGQARLQAWRRVVGV